MQHWDDNGTRLTPTHSKCILFFCDHFTRHVMAYVTPNQAVKTVVKFLWQGYILIFRALAKLLSDWGATFKSNIISKLCELMGIQKMRTSPYDPQANRMVGQSHLMLVQMIRKLGKDQKADWPMHLPKLIHAYNSTRSAITGYSPHYLMFGQWPWLSINFYFPTVVSTEKDQYVNHYIADLCKWLSKVFKEVQAQSSSEAERQRCYYDHKANAFLLEPGDLVLEKANTYKGRTKVKDQWEEEPYEVEHRNTEAVPSYLMKNQQTRCSWVLHQNQLPLGWVNRKFNTFLTTYFRASLPDQGWKSLM